MRRIDFAFESLQIIAFHEGFLQIKMLRRRAQELVVGQQRRRAFAEIGEDQPRPLDHRISGMPDLILVAAVRRLARLIEASPFDVEEPAMIQAPQAAILDAAV